MRVLLLEGGGMRAAYSNGVLAAFEEAGLAVDAAYGTSAGGALCAWFAAGQARFACSTWEYAADRRILSWRRFLAGRGPLLDHDALFRIVYEEERPLDLAAVARARHPVVVTVTDVDSGEGRHVDVRPGPVLAWLRATGRLPLAAGPPVSIDGRRYVDGGLADPLPLARALEDGADEVLLVLNEPPGQREPEPAAMAWFVGRRFPALRPLVELHHRLHDDAVRLAERPPRGVAVHLLRPRRRTGVGRLTRDVPRIHRAVEMGRRDGQAFVAEHPDLFAARRPAPAALAP